MSQPGYSTPFTRTVVINPWAATREIAQAKAMSPMVNFIFVSDRESVGVCRPSPDKQC